MKKIILSLFAISLMACSAQKQEVKAAKDGSGNLVGIAKKESFLQEPFNQWFSPNYENYNLKSEVVEAMKPYLKKVTIKAFMGTWCGDSKRETPAFYKILDQTDFNYKNLELITVNRAKKTPDNLQEGFDIIRVPTFIFFKDGIEIGRFVEFPQETIEEDMLKIVSGEPYKHSYDN